MEYKYLCYTSCFHGDQIQILFTSCNIIVHGIVYFWDFFATVWFLILSGNFRPNPLSKNRVVFGFFPCTMAAISILKWQPYMHYETLGIQTQFTPIKLKACHNVCLIKRIRKSVVCHMQVSSYEPKCEILLTVTFNMWYMILCIWITEIVLILFKGRRSIPNSMWMLTFWTLSLAITHQITGKLHIFWNFHHQMNWFWTPV